MIKLAVMVNGVSMRIMTINMHFIEKMDCNEGKILYLYV